MIEIEDEHYNWAELSEDQSESWPELSEASTSRNNNNNYQAETEERDPENVRMAKPSEFEDEFQSVTESTRLQQRPQDFDRRIQINRSRGGGFGGNHPRNRDSFDRDSWNRDSFNKDSWNRDSFHKDSFNRDSRKRESSIRDSWNRNSSNRDSWNDSSDRDPWNTDTWNDSLHRDSPNRDSWNEDSYRPRRVRRLRGISPLRRRLRGISPLRRRLRGISPLRSPVDSYNRPNIMDMDNSESFRFTNHHRENASPKRRYFDNRTISPREDHDRARRRLLPAEDDDSASVIEEKRIKIERQERAIRYGKNTEDYQIYIKAVPKNQRSRNRIQHPKTPDREIDCSRRSWDAQVKIWKFRIHSWAAKYKKDNNIRNEESQKSLQSSEITNDAELENNWGIKNEMTVFSEENVDNEDCSFLDTVDITILNDNNEVEKFY